MPSANILRTTNIVRSPRVAQLEGLFDVPPAERSEQRWHVELPLDENPWNVGLIVGPSGSGKSTVLREFFQGHLVERHEWPADKAIIDAFPKSMGIKEITALLSSVGFSSPPSWLRPFAVLSNGEQFRVTLARAMAESRDIFAIDEFTSVVDRTVAQIGSAALAKAIRKRGQKMIAAACHYDILDWLEPDWTYEPHLEKFAWRRLRGRPKIELDIVRVHHSAWRSFAAHHYLSGDLNKASKCFVALYDDRPVAFTACLPLVHPKLKHCWREHRTVCLPDFQGVGIGNAMSATVASLFRGAGYRYQSRTSHPGMIRYRAGSREWKMISRPGAVGARSKTSTVKWDGDLLRLAASFEYVGPAADAEISRRLLA